MSVVAEKTKKINRVEMNSRNKSIFVFGFKESYAKMLHMLTRDVTSTKVTSYFFTRGYLWFNI